MTLTRLIILLGFLLSIFMAVIATAMMLMPPHTTRAVSMLLNDKILHFMAFFLIVLPAISVRPAVWIWVLPTAILLGLLIELIQPFFGRQRELGDFIADALGATLAVPVGIGLNRTISDWWQLKKAKRAE